MPVSDPALTGRVFPHEQRHSQYLLRVESRSKRVQLLSVSPATSFMFSPVAREDSQSLL